MICGVQRFLRENGSPDINFFSSSSYDIIKKTLDAEMKDLRRSGLGTCRKQADPISSDTEKLLWDKGTSDVIPVSRFFVLFSFTFQNVLAFAQPTSIANSCLICSHLAQMRTAVT